MKVIWNKHVIKSIGKKEKNKTIKAHNFHLLFWLYLWVSFLPTIISATTIIVSTIFLDACAFLNVKGKPIFISFLFYLHHHLHHHPLNVNVSMYLFIFFFYYLPLLENKMNFSIDCEIDGYNTGYMCVVNGSCNVRSVLSWFWERFFFSLRLKIFYYSHEELN